MVLSTMTRIVLSVTTALNPPGFTSSVLRPRVHLIKGVGFPSSLKHLNVAVFPSFTGDVGYSVKSNLVAPTTTTTPEKASLLHRK